MEHILTITTSSVATLFGERNGGWFPSNFSYTVQLMVDEKLINEDEELKAFSINKHSTAN